MSMFAVEDSSGGAIALWLRDGFEMLEAEAPRFSSFAILLHTTHI